MSLVRIWKRGRRKVLIASAMPMAIIGIPLALLLISQLRSLGHLEEASREMLTQTGVRVAEDLATAIRRDLATTSDELLDAVPDAALRQRDLETIGDALRREHRFPAPPGSLFVGFAEPRLPTTAFSVRFFDRSAPSPAAAVGGLATGAQLLPAMAAGGGLGHDTLERYVVERIREIEASGDDEACGWVEVGGAHYLLAIRASFADVTHTRVSHFVGVAQSAEDLARRNFARLVAETRSADRVFSTDQPLELSVLDERRRELYRTGASLRARSVHEAPLILDLLAHDPSTAPRAAHATTLTWSVLSGYPGTDAAALARSSTNQQRQLLLLVAVVASVGIVLSGRAIARELGVAELKAEFVSSVSHDLRTPIASIQVLAEILQRGGVDAPERVSHYGKVIRAETRKLGKLIDGILEFEKIESGGRMYAREEIDLRDPVREAVGELATQLKETGFHTVLRLPPDPVPLVGDEEALLHAFGNLIGNAIKYSEDERFLGVTMQVCDGNAVIAVQDHGRGIPAAERTKIFERFYRVRRDAGTDPAGTGLGLNIAEHVVSDHGGRISVDGNPEGGSVFTIEIPLTYEADTQSPEDEQ